MLELNFYQLKTSLYSSIFIDSLVIDTQKLERNTSLLLKKMIKPERKKLKEEKRKPTRTSNKMTISTYLSIITLNVNGKNVPIKRHGVADRIKKKKKTQLYAAYKRLTSAKDILRLKVTFSIFMRYLS